MLLRASNQSLLDNRYRLCSSSHLFIFCSFIHVFYIYEVDSVVRTLI